MTVTPDIEPMMMIALRNLSEAMTTAQLLALSERVKEVHRNGYGKVVIEWHNGHADLLAATTSVKLTDLERD